MQSGKSEVWIEKVEIILALWGTFGNFVKKVFMSRKIFAHFVA